MGCFTIRSRRMAHGLRRQTMGMFGNLLRFGMRCGGPITVDVGYAVTVAGPGCRKSLSVGQPITTVAGRCCVVADGSGCLGLSGHLVGFHGAKMSATSDGHRFLLSRWPIVGAHGTRRSMCNWGSVQGGIISWKSDISRTLSIATACPLRRVSHSISRPRTSLSFIRKIGRLFVEGRATRGFQIGLASRCHFIG